MTPEQLDELKRANDIAERQVEVLERIADKPVSRGFWQMVADDWRETKIRSMR